MRIALCISGNPKFFEMGYEYISKNLINCNQGVDVFFHCWFDETKIGEYYDGVEWSVKQDIIKEHTPQKLLDLYKPKLFIFEKQKEDIFPQNKTSKDYPKTQGSNISFQNFSMFYSMMKSQELCNAYENENNFEYDVVIRCRFDCAIIDPIEIEKCEITKYSKEVFYLNSCRNLLVMADWIFLSNSKNMKEINNVYLLLDKYIFEDTVMLCGEEILTHHLNKINIKKSPINISLYLIRDKDFQNKQFGRSW